MSHMSDNKIRKRSVRVCWNNVNLIILTNGIKYTEIYIICLQTTSNPFDLLSLFHSFYFIFFIIKMC